MIVWRALQGFIGGGMVPTVFASAYAIFPRSKQPVITPLIGLVATLAPTIGPTVGGYLTDMLSWHWLFFINIVPGIVVTIAAATLIDFDKPNWSLFERFDFLGLILMALFLGALEYVLEDGPRYDWFEDFTIAFAAVVSASCGGYVLHARADGRQPIVDLRAFTDRNFALGSMFSFVLGIGLYGLTYLYPVFLGADPRLQRAADRPDLVRVRRHDVPDRAACRPADDQTRSAPDAGVRIPSWRSAIGRRPTSPATGTSGELFVPQVLRGFGMMFAIVPITSISLGTLKPEMLKNGSGLFNLMRNLGGAVGLAGLNTVLDKRIDLHLARLHDSITWSRRPVVEALHNFAARMPGSDAQNMALKYLFHVHPSAGHRHGLCRRVPAGLVYFSSYLRRSSGSCAVRRR